MSAAELAYLSIEEAAAQIARRALSPVELVRATLERIAALNPRLNAYLTVLAEPALAAAAEAEAAIGRGDYRGPLHGIPVGLKDIVHVAGVRTTGGSRSLGDFVASEDAAVTARLRAAGAIIVGKTHTHELAGGATSVNPFFGPARNPWDPTRIPGGSSGGSGIAVAAGLAQATIGTDTGGSVRLPAALCGAVGLKATLGRVSRRGVLARSWTMDHVGPLTRRVRDAAIVLGAIAGHDPADPHASRRPVPDYLAACTGDIRGLRVGVLQGPYIEQPLEPQIAAACAEAVGTLERLGARLAPVRLAHIAAAFHAGSIITLAEASSTQDETLRARPGDYGDDLRVAFEVGELISARQYLRALRVRPVVQRELGAALREVDVLVCPTVSILPPPIGAPTVRVGDEELDVGNGMLLLARLTRPFSMAGVPAVAVPCGFAQEGLPISLQIIGRPWDEATILRVGHAYEAATTWHQRRPPL
jgi:aspartyl-tRNA(Asn)/glutamyl-tRNA(Gln) amidotransferase subunit A